jgi:hypothetical protein
VVIYGRNVGGTEQHILRPLLYAGTFAHCANGLVKLTPGGRKSQLNYLNGRESAINRGLDSSTYPF